jgi:hypothetical protein
MLAALFIMTETYFGQEIVKLKRVNLHVKCVGAQALFVGKTRGTVCFYSPLHWITMCTMEGIAAQVWENSPPNYYKNDFRRFIHPKR